MRDIYNKGKNKKLGSGSEADSRKLPRDNSMSFLDEVKTSNNRLALIGIVEIIVSSTQLFSFYDYSTTTNINLLHSGDIINLDESLENVSSEPQSKQRKSSKGEWSHFEHFRMEMKKNQEQKFDLIEKICKSPEKTDLQLFFISISKTVEKFSRKDQAILKLKIHQIVSEQEISNLNSTQNVVENVSSM